MSKASDVRHILVIEDQKSKRIVSLKENTYTVGRDPNASIILYDRQVSRHHATLLRIKDYQNRHSVYRIIDGNLQGKKSTNGIIVNGKYTLDHELKSGDLIRFGTTSKASYHILPSTSTPLEMDLLKARDIEDKITESQSDIETIEFEELFEEEPEETNTIIFNREKEKSSAELRSESSSLTENNPNLIVDINYDGALVYLNRTARFKFPDLLEKQVEHPLLKGLNHQIKAQEETSLVREIQINEEWFKQHINYLPEPQIIRIYSFDITPYKTIESQLKFREERYEFLVEKASEGILLIDAQTKQIIDANLGICELLGYDHEEIINLNLYNLIALDREIIEAEFEQVIESSSDLIDESLYRCQDGSLISVEAKINSGQYRGKDIFYISIQDITDRKRSEEQMQYQAFHDPLTNLPNRKLFTQQVSLALNNAKKNQTLLAVIFLDLDSFNHINNTLGHSIGDQLLQSFAQRLISCIPAGDTIARWGSDDFTILLPRIKNIEETVKLSEKIFEDLKQPFRIENQQLQVKISLGIAIYPQDGEDEESLLKNAAVALTKAKEQGRNNYQFYTPLMSAQSALLLKLENALHRALERRELSLYYQPQIKISTGEVTAMEALLRWEVPEVGFISPIKLFSQGQKTDVILQISQWILQTACEQNLAWQELGLPSIPISINLSNREFEQQNLVENVARVLQKTGLDPQWLELEITETILRKNLKSARQVFQDFYNLGVRLALDDFGSGFSSIGYFKLFPFRTVKIHQSFIRDLRGASQEMALISALLTLGKGFNLRVVAEGVETSSQLELLKSLQCEEVQGYVYTRPLKSAEATQFLTKQLSLTFGQNQ
ncbi:diguanylate cyclase/phosphodiesterase with PAS/PAC sensor(s) [Gloeothece citriformis PCC 7424]|uniref:Diguanylate cyclase/phosphodiesterase with PAS/PAC sensor(S) n=1 Tax=Gloeothece citriformis (strain PCC 7424) TaxID=65393 RepID=B7KBH2_GLOC7|nr:EAL domain-containing protein [Gloeothece citriformis]ACK71528.1 diguanylate cyclase/phosphodiesterase with PAS/PAC sensor(s) [Gloeothece citriformis PCC 7424]